MALPLKSRGPSAAEQLRDRLVDAWARSDKIFAIVGTGQTFDQADRLASSVYFLYRSFAGVFLEPGLRRHSALAVCSMLILTICSAAASIPTSTPANATGTRKYRINGPALVRPSSIVTKSGALS